MNYTRVLTIAGSDCSGGAGIQADIKTISANGCYAASAITAVTVQNTVGVTAVHPVPVEVIRGQIAAVLDDIGADAIKIGMLHSTEVVEAVADMLELFADKPLAARGVGNIVQDPVMVSTSGHRLIEESATRLMTDRLMPMARVITPNIPEAEVLLGGRHIDSQDMMPDVARELSRLCHTSVLLKAGHMEDDDTLIDVLYDAATGLVYELPSSRVETRNTHGTGCTLSSALAAMLAKGMPLPEAAKAAKEYIAKAITAGADYEIGMGHGPVKHFFA